MNVAQIGRKFRQPDLDIAAVTIPIQQRLNGEVMPQVMNTCPLAISRLAQADSAGDQQEPSVHGAMKQALSSFPYEEADGWRLREKPVAKLGIFLESFTGGRMQ